MSSHKNGKTNVRKPPEGGTLNASLTVKIESESSFIELDAHMLAGQVFYILDKDFSEVLKENKNTIWGDLLKTKDSGREEHLRRDIAGAREHSKIPSGADLHGR